MAHSQTVTRTLTNIAARGDIRIEASVNAPPGIRVTVEPRQLNLKAGQSGAYQVTLIDDGSAVIGKWVHGGLTWVGDGYRADSPIVVRPVMIDVDAR